MTATPAKLKNGTWGARVQGEVRVGDVVTITTKGGKSWDAKVTRVLWAGDGVAVCATENKHGSASSRSSSQRSSGTGPSPKQVSYAASLIRRLRSDDYGTYTTFGLQGLDEAALSKMSSKRVSEIIEMVKDELYL